MNEELISLIEKLRDESSFVQSEKRHLIELYKQVTNKTKHQFDSTPSIISLSRSLSRSW